MVLTAIGQEFKDGMSLWCHCRVSGMVCVMTRADITLLAVMTVGLTEIA